MSYSPKNIFSQPFPKLQGISFQDQQRFALDLQKAGYLEKAPELHDAGKKLIARVQEFGELSSDELCCIVNSAHETLRRVDRISAQNASTIFDFTRDASLAAHIALLKGYPEGLTAFYRFGWTLAEAQQSQPQALQVFSESEAYHGADSLSHGCRLGLIGPAFLEEYNKHFSQTSYKQIVSTRVRNHRTAYSEVYQHFRPHTKISSLEDIIADGSFIPVSSAKIKDMGVVFNLHDFAKFENLHYFESSQKRNESAIRQHTQGISQLLDALGPLGGLHSSRLQELKFIIANHHGNYGKGYGSHLDLQGLFLMRNTQHAFSSVLSFNLADVESYKSVDYFMNKVLDILDTFDALSEARGYKSKIEPTEEVLRIMKETLLTIAKPVDRSLVVGLFGKNNAVWEYFFINPDSPKLYFKYGIISVMQRMIMDADIRQQMVAWQQEFAGNSIDPLVWDIVVDFLAKLHRKKKGEYNQFKYIPE